MSGESQATVFTARRTSFGRTAATYDAVRPEWPTKTISWMFGSPPERSLRVVDLGCLMVQIPMRTWCHRLRRS